MIKVEHIEVFNFEGAIRGCRNPLNSWHKSDSKLCKGKDFDDCTVDCVKCPRKDDSFDNDIFCIGKADLDLMHRLYVAGTPHRKYLRQIFVSMDITAPLYWWKEFDTYKVGTTSNSCSTMHTIHKRELTIDDFSHEHLIGEEDSIDEPIGTLSFIVDILNMWRSTYLRTKDKDAWWQMIQLLPSSYNQKRTITMNYENVVNIIEYRTGHKLDEWNEFVDILWELPYLKEIAGELNADEEAQGKDLILCKNCKYFEYDTVAKVDGIPLIVGHEMCNRWGDGCKTSENGYCFLAEKKKEVGNDFR